MACKLEIVASNFVLFNIVPRTAFFTKQYHCLSPRIHLLQTAVSELNIGRSFVAPSFRNPISPYRQKGRDSLVRFQSALTIDASIHVVTGTQSQGSIQTELTDRQVELRRIHRKSDALAPIS